jgi:heparin binding hemagglutinin HbhA
MAQAKFDIPSHVPVVVARPIYAGVGATDRVVEIVREVVRGALADVQKRALAAQEDVQKTVAGIDYQPQALREQATRAVSARVGSFGKDALAGRRAVENRVAGFQTEAKNLPVRLQKVVDDQVTTAGDTYEDFVRRGETLVGRIRHQQSTREAGASAKTTKAKAKTTRTQATKTAKKSASTAKKTARTSPAKSSAKATATSAEETATSAAQTTTDAASNVGDSTE